MYAIYAYIDPQNHPNVGKYTIHGVSGLYDTILRGAANVGESQLGRWNGLLNTPRPRSLPCDEHLSVAYHVFVSFRFKS